METYIDKTVQKPQSAKTGIQKKSQIIDNRPSYKASRNLKKIMQKKSSHQDVFGKPVLSENQNIIQRMVLNLDTTDPKIGEAAAIELERQKLSMENPKSFTHESNLPLFQLGENEELTLLAHGEPLFGAEEPKVAGKTPMELYKTLRELGLTPDKKGNINLSNCTTAWERWGEESFAERFRNILISRGFKNKVTGFRSFVSSYGVDDEKEAAYEYREQYFAILLSHRYLGYFTDLMNPSGVEEESKALENIKKAKQTHGIEAGKMLQANWDKRPDKKSVLDYHMDLQALFTYFLGEYLVAKSKIAKEHLVSQYMENFMEIKNKLQKATPGLANRPEVKAKRISF